MSYYKNTFETKKMPQRIAFYDGVKAEKNCQKLLDLNTCENLVSQNINEYKLFMHDPGDKELHGRSICRISPTSFETATTKSDYWKRCTFDKHTKLETAATAVRPTELFATIETSDAFDGSYSFKLSLLHSISGSSKRIGNGYIEINNGIMTVAKDGRSIVNGSEDLYDSFEGRIDKKGNIISWLTIIPQCSTTDMTLVGLDLKGHIKRQIKNKCFVDNDGGGADFDVVLKLRKKE